MSERLDRYFALETVDYLDQIEGLLNESGRPDVDHLLRLCRGVHGSAQMAGAESVAGLAERLEEGLRSVQGNHVVWSEEIRQISLQTVGDLKLLVRASSRWGQLDEDRVRSAMRRWDEVEPAPHLAAAQKSSDFAEERTPQYPPGSRSPASLAPEVAVESLFYDDEGPHVLTDEPDAEMNQTGSAAVSGPVPIESLLLDAASALREALALRDELERAIRGVPGAEVELSGTVRELFELLEIAAGGIASRG